MLTRVMQNAPFTLSPSTRPVILSLSKETGRLRTGLSKGEKGYSCFDRACPELAEGLSTNDFA